VAGETNQFYSFVTIRLLSKMNPQAHPLHPTPIRA
jgi:hypothetical protein